MSPTAFIRRPQRWITALSDEARHARVITAAPNFAYEWTAQRGRPGPDDDVDLCNVVLIIGSEPVSIDAIEAFNDAFAPHGLPRTAIKPSYGIAEATLFVSTTHPAAEATVVHFDRDQLAAGHAVRVTADTPHAVAQVSSGQLARSLWGVVVDPVTGDELPDGQVGEMWLHGNNIGRGYWGLPEETRQTFGATLRSRMPRGGHADGIPTGAAWLRTGDLGVYLDGELYVTGRIADLVLIDGRTYYPQTIESTTADASPSVRRGYVAAFSVSAADVGETGGDRLVIIAERATGSGRTDLQQAVDAIRADVEDRHGLHVHDARILSAGAIPRTTSGKLARRACKAQYLAGAWG
jgi:fatty-acyl-CoA synthase